MTFIKKIANISSAINCLHFMEINNNTLVLFDIDNVIIAAKDQVLRPCGYAIGAKLLDGITTKANFDYYFAEIMKQAVLELVDKNIHNLINFFRSRNASILGLTKTKTGAIQHHNTLLEDIKIDLLKSFNINFHTDETHGMSKKPGKEF